MDTSSSSKYKHIFFDLDHTLWDFEGNSRITLGELFKYFDLTQFGIPSIQVFIQEYERINTNMWILYRNDEIDKPTLRNTRFIRVLEHWDIVNDSLAHDINERYLTEGPKKKGLLPNAIKTLEYLKKGYQLHLITNGFKEVQHMKLSGSGLLPFFKEITTSEETGFLKPDPRVFDIAIKGAGANKRESLYIGDHYETDILGGIAADIDQVFFNPNREVVEQKPTYEIEDLIELTVIL
jgi:putative hydrolase of the HAD superfamily